MELSKKNFEVLKEKIQTERERLVEGFDEINGDKYILSGDDRFDEVDQAASDYERSKLIRFRNRDHFYKKKLDKALQKFTIDEYGVCEECDETIKFERLFARPTAELCITCKDDAERAEQGNFIARQSKSAEKKSAFNSAQ